MPPDQKSIKTQLNAIKTFFHLCSTKLPKANANDIDMIFREADVMKSLDHKNIVKIMNCFTLSN